MDQLARPWRGVQDDDIWIAAVFLVESPDGGGESRRIGRLKFL
jgi:hypothetical protein